MPQPHVYNGDLKYSLWPVARLVNGRVVKLKARCCWCSTILSHAQATIDHDPPKAFGGIDTEIVLACRKCNNKRSEDDSKLCLLYRVILAVSIEDYLLFLRIDFDLRRFYERFQIERNR